MLSKAHKHMDKILTKISKSLNVKLEREVKDGNKKYDFYFKTKPPIIVEVDGSNHQQNKVDGYFFKNLNQLIRYKKNDCERNMLNNINRIKLFRFKDNEFPSVIEVLDIFGDDVIEILKNGEKRKNGVRRICKRAIKKHKSFNRREEKLSE